MRIKVTADSTCDLPAELVSEYGIDIMPLIVIRGSEALRDGVDITAKEVFEYFDSGAGICSTSAINTEDYIEFFKKYKDDYDAVVHINLSSELSCCYVNTVAAAQELGFVYPVDSRNLSSGSGHLALDAVLLAREGMQAPEIQKELSARAEKLEVSFILDTLTYLHKGGRCSSVAALGANLLQLKPCIDVKNGGMGVGKKYRGNLEKVLLQYVRERLSGRDDIDKRRIFITTSGMPEETMDKLEAEIKAHQDFDEIIRSQAGCTISSHCGPRCLGILFYRK